MNSTFHHPGQPQMQAQVILASTSAMSPPIVTVRGRLPRCIWPEVLTHRKFARNARSSRAVPVQKMIDEIRNDPFIPWHWGKNQRGMQAAEECSNWVNLNAHSGDPDLDAPVRNEIAWLSARNEAVKHAEAFMEAGYHKQVVNRLLEPFMWIDVLITATDWENFFWLRDHKDAEPHLQDFARLVMQAMKHAKVQELEPGEWHQPYTSADDEEEAYRRGVDSVEFLNKMSAARCARISYEPFDGQAGYDRELERYNQLINSERVHASPVEHQATPDEMVTASVDLFDDGNSSLFPDETLDAQRVYKMKNKHGNLTGWIQNRKLIPEECFSHAA